MNVVTQSWIIENLTIGCEKIANSRQHSEPIEYEELGRQLRQRSRGKEGKARFANEGTFAFCLRFFWVPLWMLESEVREWAFFILSLSWILKRCCLNMLQLSKYRSTWPNKWLWQMQSRGRRPRAVLKTKGTVFSHMDQPSLVNNIIIFFWTSSF